MLGKKGKMRVHLKKTEVETNKEARCKTAEEHREEERRSRLIRLSRRESKGGCDIWKPRIIDILDKAMDETQADEKSMTP